MKTKILAILVFSMFAILPAMGQINLGKLIDKSKKKAQKKIEQRIEKRIDKKTDETLDEAEDAIDGENENKKKESKTSDSARENINNEVASDKTEVKEQSMNVNWAKFDFVPGDEVIFEDMPSVNEENGEFPSRWDLVKGQIEIAEVNGENVIMFIDGSPMIIPYMKEPKKDYLPDVFTVEFDMYRPANGNRFQVTLYDQKNQSVGNHDEIEVNTKSISVGDINGEHPEVAYEDGNKGRWMHISLAYTKGKLKMYMDDTRLINIPRYEPNPTGFTIGAYFADKGDNKAFYLKNFRISKGGVKYYDRAMQDGKIVCNGIRFDVNKTTLKPESMGPINEIYELMKKKTDLKFSVEGHTDGDGDEAANQKLSEGRAKVVMEKLIEMGISSERLSSKGWGESKPIGGNNTAEGKANNRRVEFVKI